MLGVRAPLARRRSYPGTGVPRRRASTSGATSMGSRRSSVASEVRAAAAAVQVMRHTAHLIPLLFSQLTCACCEFCACCPASVGLCSGPHMQCHYSWACSQQYNVCPGPDITPSLPLTCRVVTAAPASCCVRRSCCFWTCWPAAGCSSGCEPPLSRPGWRTSQARSPPAAWTRLGGATACACGRRWAAGRGRSAWQVGPAAA
jgi:hypothetical protein